MQPVADDIGVRELAFVRQNFPSRIKQRVRLEVGSWDDSALQLATCNLQLQPRFQILLETFLRLQVFRDDDDGPPRKKFLQQRGEKRLGGRG